MPTPLLIENMSVNRVDWYPNNEPVLPMTTILASIPCSYLDFEYGSMRGYSAMQNDVEGEGGVPRRAGGREKEAGK